MNEKTNAACVEVRQTRYLKFVLDVRAAETESGITSEVNEVQLVVACFLRVQTRSYYTTKFTNMSYYREQWLTGFSMELFFVGWVRMAASVHIRTKTTATSPGYGNLADPTQPIKCHSTAEGRLEAVGATPALLKP